MKKRKVLAAVLLIAVLAAGCGEEIEQKGTAVPSEGTETKIETEADEDSQIKNGDKISVQLTDKVALEAVVQLPEAGLEGIELCRVRTVGYEGELAASLLSVETPLEQWEQRKGDGGYAPEIRYHYEGELSVGSVKKTGSIITGFGLGLQTDHWNFCDDYFYTYGIGGQKFPLFDYPIDEELPSMSMEEAKQAGKEYLEEVLGAERAEPVRIYAYSHEGMAQYQKEQYEHPENYFTGKPQELELTEWTEADDCYEIEYEQYFQGIPVLSNLVSRKDDAYVPGGISTVGITPDGIEYLNLEPYYERIDGKETELAPLEEVLAGLQRKFDMMIIGTTILDEMKLIYFPLPVSVDPAKPYEFDLLPVWQFGFGQEDYREYIYINAVDGSELSY